MYDIYVSYFTKIHHIKITQASLPRVIIFDHKTQDGCRNISIRDACRKRECIQMLR